MSSRLVAEGKYLRFVERDGYEMIERMNCSGVAVVIPLTAAGELVLVEQYRVPLGRGVIELPAGLVSDRPGEQEESCEAAAARELEEETGFRADTLEWVAEWPTSCGMTSETVTVFVARKLSKVGAGGGDHTEKISVHVVSLKEIDSWLKDRVAQGIMVDAKVYAALHLIGDLR